MSPADSTTGPRPAPYPADTRAKGWRFELDMERIQQSDTWDLASEIPMAKPALLMMWTVAWSQVPCGSMPADQDLIRAKLCIPRDLWPQMREIVLRGWWLADDGRLYHDVLTERVNEMLATKERERLRKQAWREKQGKKDTPNRTNVPRDIYGTRQGQSADGRGIDDTGTGTGSGIGIGVPTLVTEDQESSARTTRARADASESSGDGIPPTPPAPPPTGPRTPAAAACRAMRAAGLSDASPSHPRLIAALDAGVTVDELCDAARTAVAAGKGFAYAIATAVGRRADAAEQAAQPTPTADPDSRSAIEAEGIAKGIGPWDEAREQWGLYKRRVRGHAGASVAPNVLAVVTAGLARRSAA